MKNFVVICCLMLFMILVNSEAKAQSLLKKLKKQTEQKVLKKTDKMLEEAILGEDSNDPNNPGSTSNPGNNSGSNTVYLGVFWMIG